MRNRPRHRTALRSAGALLVSSLLVSSLLPGIGGVQAADPADGLRADLDGTAISLRDVGRLHCHDLDYPRIHCFATAERAAQSIQVAATDAVGYVVIYDGSGFHGSSLYVSQDYTVLATIGWNDRISSFRAINGESGRLYTDWFYGGSSWSFCCNQQVSSLGSFDDAFSSVQRT
jgi:hypothetical protein